MEILIENTYKLRTYLHARLKALESNGINLPSAVKLIEIGDTYLNESRRLLETDPQEALSNVVKAMNAYREALRLLDTASTPPEGTTANASRLLLMKRAEIMAHIIKKARINASEKSSLLENLTAITEGHVKTEEAYKILSMVTATLRHEAIMRLAAQKGITTTNNETTTTCTTCNSDDMIFDTLMDSLSSSTTVMPPSSMNSGNNNHSGKH